MSQNRSPRKIRITIEEEGQETRVFEADGVILQQYQDTHRETSQDGAGEAQVRSVETCIYAWTGPMPKGAAMRSPTSAASSDAALPATDRPL